VGSRRPELALERLAVVLNRSGVEAALHYRYDRIAGREPLTWYADLYVRDPATWRMNLLVAGSGGTLPRAAADCLDWYVMRDLPRAAARLVPAGLRASSLEELELKLAAREGAG